MGVPTVPFKQLESPKPKITANPQGLSAVVRFRTEWADAFTFTNEILGILDGAPWQWPASPNMRAYNADIEPVGIGANLTATTGQLAFGSSPGEFYSHALITVTFGSQASLTTMPFTDTINVPPALQFDPQNPVEMSSYQVTYGTEMLKLPAGSLTWSTNNADGSNQTIPAGVAAPESGAAYARTPTFDLNMTLHNCLYVDYSIVRNKIGFVNNATMFTNCERETVLLNGLSTNRREMSDGRLILDVTLNYKWKAVGWNVAFGSDGNLYRYVMKNKVPPAVYPETNINPEVVLPAAVRWKPYNFNGIPGR